MTAFRTTTDIDDDSTVVVLPGDTPLLRPPPSATWCATHESRGQRRHRARRPSWTTRPATAGSPRRDGRVPASWSSATPHPTSWPSTRWAPASTCFRRDLLGPALRRLSPDNAQGEYYLTDVIGCCRRPGYPVGAMVHGRPRETQGVNDRAQLALAEAELRARTNRHWLLNGVTMLDPAADLHRRHRRARPRRHPLPRHDAAGPHRGRRRLRDRPRHPPRRLHRRARRPRARTPSPASTEIGEGARVGPYSVLQPGSRVAAGAVTGAFYTGLPD